ncbi:MAG: glycoside hydrolase family 3 C-terminal domain-containing protein [Bacteroidales bacterium]|nr:glycoside hydrolase family 3 C-terminal domain-containing protein [Bacteroidales bacterium]
MKNPLILAAAACCLLAGCTAAPAPGALNDPRVDELMKKMTLEEKVGQLVLFTSDWSVTGPTMRQGYMDDIRAGRCGNIFNAYTAEYTRKLQEIAVNETRLGIPLLFGYDVIHGFRTIFPINLGMSASWDGQAIEESARIAAREAAAAGLHWTYSPMCDICVEPRWGRISEGSGEDPYLGSVISAAMTRGYQGTDLSDPATILACVKHFAAYGAPQAGRDYNTVDMSERWFREFYLPPYKAAVDAGALSVMASFNELDGVPATANSFLLKDILRGEWGFKGFVVSDYTGINEMVCHGTAADEAEAGMQAINAGMDMDMQSAAYFNYLKEQVESGKVSMKTLDESVRRVLNVKAALGLFDDPYKYCSPELEASETLTDGNKAFARKFASDCMVLLSNDGVLPLQKGEKIAVIGALAASKDDLLGSWRGAGEVRSVPASILDAICELNGPANVLYAEGCKETGEDRSGFGAALAVARRASKVVLVIGEDCQWTGEAASRSDIRIPGVQSELLGKLAALGKPVAVVLLNGRPLDLSAEVEQAGAILEAWYPGTMGGFAVADVLFGDVNPGGKLSVTFPRNLGQVPVYHYAKNTGRPYVHPEAKYESRYLDVPNEPLFAFGHGLSYTRFDYSDVRLSASSFGGDGNITAECTVTNSGGRAGSETVQLYIRDLVGSVTRPVKQLKGFKKIYLEPGQSQTVSFTIDAETLSFYRRDMSYGPESGDFKVFIGGASDDVREASFRYEE